jgi:aminoglycoside phosphotransferase (APT) family kinase protein
MISPQGIARYLLRRKLLRGGENFAAGFSIANASRRNHVLRVMHNRSTSYLIKQGIDAERIRTIEREASVYQALGGSTKLSPYLPGYYGYDPGHQILILGLFTGTQDLRSYHESRARPPAFIGAMLGEALAEIHSYRPRDRRSRNAFARLGQHMPGIFRVHRPSIRSFRNISAGQIELIKIVQRFGFRQHLERIRRGWQPSSFTHGDLRWDNCLVPAHFPGEKKAGLKIVDWEFGGFGDPGWDVGFLFAEYLSFWISFIPVTGDSPPDRYLNFAKIPLERMQPALCSFWSLYRRRMSQKMNLDRTETHHLLLRAVGYASARLLDTAYEEMQGSTQLTGNVISLAQLSLNMFQRSQQACTELLGIPV